MRYIVHVGKEKVYCLYGEEGANCSGISVSVLRKNNQRLGYHFLLEEKANNKFFIEMRLQIFDSWWKPVSEDSWWKPVSEIENPDKKIVDNLIKLSLLHNFPPVKNR